MPEEAVLEYWAHLRTKKDEVVGACFFLLSDRVLTSNHLLVAHGLREGDPVEVWYLDEPFDGLVEAVDEEADLAVVRVTLVENDVVSRAAKPVRAAVETPWRAPYSPILVRLHGLVREVDWRIPGLSSARVKGLQLSVDETLDDFRGYSGNPVDLHLSRNPGPTGILVKQVERRVQSEEAPLRSANVLFGVSITEALYRFAVFEVLEPAERADWDRQAGQADSGLLNNILNSARSGLAAVDPEMFLEWLAWYLGES